MLLKAPGWISLRSGLNEHQRWVIDVSGVKVFAAIRSNKCMLDTFKCFSWLSPWNEFASSDLVGLLLKLRYSKWMACCNSSGKVVNWFPARISIFNASNAWKNPLGTEANPVSAKFNIWTEIDKKILNPFLLINRLLCVLFIPLASSKS